MAENKEEQEQTTISNEELTENNGQLLFDIILEIISEHKHIEFKTTN